MVFDFASPSSHAGSSGTDLAGSARANLAGLAVFTTPGPARPAADIVLYEDSLLLTR